MDNTQTSSNCCSCGVKLNQEKYVVCTSCLEKVKTNKKKHHTAYVASAQNLIQFLESAKKQDKIEGNSQLKQLYEEEQILKQELKSLNTELHEISEENATLQITIFKNQIELLNKISQKDSEVSNKHLDLQAQLFLNMKLNQEKQRLSKLNPLVNILNLSIHPLRKKWALNDILLTGENIHLILPLIQYILEFQSSHGKVARKFVTYIDIDEKIFVVQEEFVTKQGPKRKQRQLAIEEVKPQIWLSYIVKQLREFVCHHNLEIDPSSFPQIPTTSEDSYLQEFLSLTKSILQIVDNY